MLEAIPLNMFLMIYLAFSVCLPLDFVKVDRNDIIKLVSTNIY